MSGAIQTSKTFNTACTYIDEHDQIQVVRNTFFNLYCYNEFVRDTYETNKVKHFELILRENGFNLSSQGAAKKLPKETRSQHSEIIRDMNDELFEKYLESEVKGDEKFEAINKSVEYLRLPMTDREALIEYKDIILDKWAIRDHNCIMRFFKSNEYIDNKLNELDFKGIDVKTLTNSYNKLKIIRQFEARYGINVWTPQCPTNTEMDDAFYSLIKTVFRTKLPKPTTPQDLVKFYGALVKSATTRKLINVKKGEIKINDEIAQHHLKLNAFKNIDRIGFSPEAQKHFNIKPNNLTYIDGADLGLEDGM